MRPASDHAPEGYKHVQLKYGPYSASRLLVARCPARFHSKYVLKDTIVSDSLASARGSAIHEVLQKISEARVAKQDLAGSQINRWVEESVGKYPAAYEQIKLIKDAASAYVGIDNPYLNNTTKCEATLSLEMYEEETFVDEVAPNFAYVKCPIQESNESYGRTLGSKTYFTAKLDQLSIDHENRIITVLDHKSTPSASSNSDHTFQMGCYAWAASLYYPGYHARTVIHYAHPRLNFFAPPVYWSEEDLVDMEEELRIRVGAIESFREYPALPGSHCDYCHMVQACPENRKVQEQGARGDINLNVNGTADLVRLAKQLRVTGVLYDQLNKRLKESIENICPDSGIALEGMWYGFKPGEEKIDWIATDRKIRETSEMEGLDDILKKYGVNPEVFKEWKNDKLKALFKMNKVELVDELKQFFVKDRDTRFGGHKI